MARVYTRFRYLCDLWRQAAREPALPQFDRWLVTYFKSLPQLGRRDRQWYSDMAFACVRYAAYAGLVSQWQQEDPVRLAQTLAPDPQSCWHMARSIDPDVFCRHVIALLASRGRLAEYAGKEAEGLADMVESETTAIKRLDAALARDHSIAAQCLGAGIPIFFADALATRMQISPSFDSHKFLALQATRPPVWLRINDLRQAARLRDELRHDGSDLILSGDSAIGLRGAVRLHQLAAYTEGHVEIQDLASQAIGDAVAAEGRHLIWDACAGGGGKTLQLAAAVQGQGAIYASDIRSYKLDEIKRRAARARFTNIETFVWDGQHRPNLPPRVASQGGFDRVLVDAPCTGAGTWRRSPDARFRVSSAMLSELTTLQLSILGAVEQTVRPGGRLIYGTCSWLVAENEAIISAFLSARPRWRLLRQELIGSPWLDSDTTFVAVLEG